MFEFRKRIEMEGGYVYKENENPEGGFGGTRFSQPASHSRTAIHNARKNPKSIRFLTTYSGFQNVIAKSNPDFNNLFTNWPLQRLLLSEVMGSGGKISSSKWNSI